MNSVSDIPSFQQNLVVRGVKRSREIKKSDYGCEPVVSVRKKVVSDSKQCCFCAVFFPVCRLIDLKQTIASEVFL